MLINIHLVIQYANAKFLTYVLKYVLHVIELIATPPKDSPGRLAKRYSMDSMKLGSASNAKVRGSVAVTTNLTLVERTSVKYCSS